MKKLNNMLLFSLLVINCFIANSSYAQVDTIRMQDKRLLTSQLKPGLRQYLVYFQSLKSKKSLYFWFWLRNVKLENRDGEKVFVISQHWFGNDTLTYSQIYSVNRASDFQPLYHAETARGKINAYNWYNNKIKGADSISNNTQKQFSLNFNNANFNWNLDIETFEMLPLAADKSFAINFYDAGLEPPKFVVYKVIGSETINTYDNHPVDCWKLFTESDYHGTHITETFWISKKSHEFLKEEDFYGNAYRYKIKLPASSSDLMARFNK